LPDVKHIAVIIFDFAVIIIDLKNERDKIVSAGLSVLILRESLPMTLPNSGGRMNEIVRSCLLQVVFPNFSL
jgi:hypothetical protein